MERSDQEIIEEFMTVAGVSEAVAIQKLQEHGGDLNSALDAYFAESNENSVPVIMNASAPRRDPIQFDDMVHSGPRAPELSLLSAGGILDRFFGTSNNRSLFNRPTFFPSREMDESNFHRSVFDRIPMFPTQEPFVSHPREVREIPIEVKDSNESSTIPRLGPTIVDVSETEHVHGPEIHGTVTMDDEDYASENELPFQSTQADYASDNDVTAQSDYIDNDIEEQMILAALEASQRDAEEKYSAKTLETGMVGDTDSISGLIHEENEEELPKYSGIQGSQPTLEPGNTYIFEDDEDAEVCPLVRQKPKSLSSSFKEPHKDDVDGAPLALSSFTGHDQSATNPSVGLQSESTHQHDEVDRHHAIKEASLPPEPLPDENNVVNILLRMPDGRRLSRRCLTTDKLKLLFSFIQNYGGLQPEKYKLARSYPRRTFSVEDGSLTLEEIGLTSKQEALYVEPV